MQKWTEETVGALEDADILYSEKLWRALNLANQSSECIGEFLSVSELVYTCMHDCSLQYFAGSARTAVAIPN